MGRPLARLVRDVVRSNFREPPLPFKLTFIATYHCQLRCNMCSIWQRRPEGELTLDEVGRFFRTNPHFTWVNVSGGEIFLRPDAAEVLESIVQACPDLYLLDFPTHGQQTGRVVDAVERLLATRLPRLLITVSVDGPAALHDRIRGVDGAWDKAMETFERLRALRRRGYRPFLGMTLQSENVDAFDATFEAAARRVPGLRPRDLHVNLAHVSGHYYENNGLDPLDPRRAEKALDRIRRRRGLGVHPVAVLERRYQRLAKRFLRTGRTPLPCHATSSSIFLDSTGNVYPCSIYDRRLGNLRDHDLDLRALLETARVARLRKEIRRGQCPQCWTPCEAYPTILANLWPRPLERARVGDPVPVLAPGSEPGAV